MIREFQIPLFDLILCLSETTDLINPLISHHHKQVSYLALAIAQEIGLPVARQKNILIAGALHDVGALSLKEKLWALEFDGEDLHRHAEMGYFLLKSFDPLATAASLIRYHHTRWENGKGRLDNHQAVPIESHILHLADRVVVLIDKSRHILDQVDTICETIQKQSGSMFVPEQVEAFMKLAVKEYIWLDIVSPIIYSTLSHYTRLPTLVLNIDEITTLTKIFSHIIDFRSHFTATHSSGVAITSKAIASIIGFSDRECQMIEIAGYLHDLGKLAIPIEILDKPGPLTKEELSIVKSHTFFTFRSLECIEALNEINGWASFHHERVNGAGYPFHHTGNHLSLGSRILAVADVFTAIMEDRPYRKGMSSQNALATIQEMGEQDNLDTYIVDIVKNNFDEINQLRMAAQIAAENEYNQFLSNSTDAQENPL